MPNQAVGKGKVQAMVCILFPGDFYLLLQSGLDRCGISPPASLL